MGRNTAEKVVVLGGAGFVGRALSATLPQSELLVVDRAPARPLPAMSSAAEPNVVSLLGDSLMTCDEARGASTAVVLAGQTDVDEALRNPEKAFRQNISIAVDAAEWLRRNLAARLVYISSDEVLGVSDQPLSETATLRPTQPYAASKAAAEEVLDCYAKTYGLDLVILRSCNLVGEHQRARKLIPTAVMCLATGRPVPIYGAGTAVREWMAVEDLVAAIVMAAERRIPRGVYHCTTSCRLSSLDVTTLVARALDREVYVEHVPDRLVHDSTYAMSSALIRSFGWTPCQDVAQVIDTAARRMHAAQQAGADLTSPGAEPAGLNR